MWQVHAWITSPPVVLRAPFFLTETLQKRPPGWLVTHCDCLSIASFDKIKVPSYDKILEAVRIAHKDIPHFRIIGWDFSIDENGEPVFIEYNGAPAMNQVSFGPLFGELTESVLNTIFLNEAEFGN